MQCHLVIVFVALCVVTGERSAPRVQQYGAREKIAVAADSPSPSGPAEKQRREIAISTSGMSNWTCFDCHYSVNGNRQSGDPVCLDEFNTDQHDRPVAEVDCIEGSCEKSWLYLGKRDFSITRRCSLDCHEHGDDGTDYLTRCCRGRLCNGAPARLSESGYCVCLLLLLALWPSVPDLQYEH